MTYQLQWTTYLTQIRPLLEYSSPVWGDLPQYLKEELKCVNIYNRYWQYTNLFIFRFIRLLYLLILQQVFKLINRGADISVCSCVVPVVQTLTDLRNVAVDSVADPLWRYWGGGDSSPQLPPRSIFHFVQIRREKLGEGGYVRFLSEILTCSL